MNMEVLSIHTAKKEEFIDITSTVKSVAANSGIKDGICIIFCPHTTAGLTINENADPAVRKDIIKHLGKLVPEDAEFFHAEGNSDGHIKSSVIGVSLNLIIEESQLVLGTWQGIYFCEFDGPRTRKVYVKIIGE